MQQDDEFVTVDSGGHSGIANDFRNSVGDGSDHRVAGLVATSVV